MTREENCAIFNYKCKFKGIMKECNFFLFTHLHLIKRRRRKTSLTVDAGYGDGNDDAIFIQVLLLVSRNSSLG